jgi:hypothetical protein
MKFMLEHKIIFYLRIKQGQQLHWVEQGRFVKAKKIGKHTKDTVITLYGYKLRLIISPPPPKQKNLKKKQNTERWYILTNDMTSAKEVVISIYATRFEIEETFKDLKHIQKLKVLRIRKKETFCILLWFASVAFWIAFWIKGGKNKGKGKKTRSFFRIYWEELQRELRQEGLWHIVLAPG